MFSLVSLVFDVHVRNPAQPPVTGTSASRRPGARREYSNGLSPRRRLTPLVAANRYDPHGYTASWAVANEAHYAAIPNTTPAQQTARTELLADISDVLTISDEAARQAKWTEILTEVHGSAINLPFSGKGNPTVLNKRLTGYTPGQQQFDYPLHTLSATTGANSITVAPASQSGLFSTVGRLDPHTYRPNEFWANNLVYEGLTKCKYISSLLSWLAPPVSSRG